ncbi:MAG: hypothetical protein LBB04_02120 [Oscillospiraceae bacterium]|jgi:hypothetical protein|nr:hypothetical protein [Oscillospiraceae bacterium]
MKKQTRNRYQKGLAKVLAVAFCTLCWTPAVYADEVLVGKDKLWDQYLVAWKDAVAKANGVEAKATLDVTYRLTDDQKMDATIEIYSGMKVTIELAGHKIFRQADYLGFPDEQPTDVRRNQAFSVRGGGTLIVRGPGMLDDELLPDETVFGVESGRFWVGSLVRVEAGGLAEIDGTAGAVVFGNNIIKRNKGGVVFNYGTCVISFAELPDDVDTPKGGAICNAGKLTLRRRVEVDGTMRVQDWQHDGRVKPRFVNSHVL